MTASNPASDLLSQSSASKSLLHHRGRASAFARRRRSLVVRDGAFSAIHWWCGGCARAVRLTGERAVTPEKHRRVLGGLHRRPYRGPVITQGWRRPLRGISRCRRSAELVLSAMPHQPSPFLRAAIVHTSCVAGVAISHPLVLAPLAFYGRGPCGGCC